MTDSTQSLNIDNSSRISSGVNSKAAFLRKTYVHLSGAIVLFALLTALIQSTPLALIISNVFFSSTLVAFAILIAFIFVSSLARSWSMSDVSKSMQYVGLGMYVLAETIFFTPIIYIFVQGAPELLALAVGATVAVSVVLTLMAFTTGTNFTFLRGFLSVGGLLALGVILLSFIFPGLASSFIFLGFMLLFACAAILYQTSRIIHDYPTDKYVAASLGLFASIMLLFWYILRIMLKFTSSR